MKFTFFYTLSVVCLILIPGLARAEYIERLESNIDIHTDGSFTVTEVIDYVFSDARHGIFRYIPTHHPQEADKWYQERYVLIDVDSVLMDDAEVPYEVTDEGDQIFIKIGDPNVLVDGWHTYTIEYTVDGGISYPKFGGAELYWNVTGFDWPVAMRNVFVNLTLPEGVMVNERACYRGYVGAESSCTTTRAEGNTVRFSAAELFQGEGITIAQAVDSSKIKKVTYVKTNTFWFWIPVALIWFIGLALFVFRYKTEYRTGRTIIAEYEPYQDFKPMYAGLLFDGTLNPHDITACIVYLAEQGYLKIKKVDKKVLFFFEVDDYEIELIKPIDVLTAFQKDVLKLLFGTTTTVGTKVALSKLKNDIGKQKENQKLLRELKKDLEQDLEDTGFFQVTVPTTYIVGGVGVVLAILFAVFQLVMNDTPIFIPIAIGFVAISVVILAFGYRRRTRKGYEALDHLEGFRLFLSMTEKERYAFHNAPQKSPEQFMKYLPYAIAFEVEEEWAEVFKDITIPNPDWYDGGSVSSFSATNLSTSLGAFSTAFAASSGSSASSGGGSVGGGGGGGGGGSW